MSAHVCHATDCQTVVPPRMFMCRSHWFKLPKRMRDELWAAYVPGQEDRKDPTAEYIEVARRCIAFVEARDSGLSPAEAAEASQGALFGDTQWVNG